MLAGYDPPETLTFCHSACLLDQRSNVAAAIDAAHSDPEGIWDASEWDWSEC